VVVLIISIRRNGQGGAMSFGRSRARRFVGQPQQVTFADVAGVAEAKEELYEIVEFLKSPEKFHAMGARIRIRSGGTTQIREIAGGGSYLSQSDLRANFGVGRAQSVESIEITWPSGQSQRFRDLPVDHFYVVHEGENEMRPAANSPRQQ